MKISIKCLTCGEESFTYPCRVKNGQKYCGAKCMRNSLEWREKISLKRKENNPGGFKKKKPQHSLSSKEYNTLHAWIRRNFGKPTDCEGCGAKKLSGKSINWANVTGNYVREKENWKRLCKRCHYKQDSGIPTMP